MKSLAWLLTVLINNVLTVDDVYIEKTREVKFRLKDIDLKDSTYSKSGQKHTRDVNIVEKLKLDEFAREATVLPSDIFSVVNSKINLTLELKNSFLKVSGDNKDNYWRNILKLSEYNGSPDVLILPSSHTSNENVNNLKLNESESNKTEYQDGGIPLVVMILVNQKLLKDDRKKQVRKRNLMEEKAPRPHIKLKNINSSKLTALKKDHNVYDNLVYQVKSKCTEGNYYKTDPCNLCYCTKGTLQCTAVKCTKEKAKLSADEGKLKSRNKFYKKLRDEATECKPGMDIVVVERNVKCPCKCIVPSVMYCPLCPAVEKIIIPRKNITHSEETTTQPTTECCNDSGQDR